MNQARDIKDNKKDFCKCRHHKRSTTENVSPLLPGAGNLTAQESAPVLNSIFSPLFCARASLQESWVPETKGKAWRKECIPFVEGNQIRQYLFKLDIHHSMSLDGMLPGVLRKIVTGRSASGLEEGKCHPCVQERQKGVIMDLPASQPCFNPQKMMEQLILQNIFQACFTKARKPSRVVSKDSPKKCCAGPVIKQK